MTVEQPTLHGTHSTLLLLVEVLVTGDGAVEEQVKAILQASTVLVNHPFSGYLKDAELAQKVQRMRICELEPLAPNASFVDVARCSLAVHTYTFQPPTNTSPARGDEEEPAAFHCTPLPCAEIDGLWEGLYFEDGTQWRLLQFVNASAKFAMAGVDHNLVAFNRMIMLHGEPGTGKTSLCRALAQKVAIRSPGRRTLLLEISSHQLFSKWFSESGKLIASMFDRIATLAQEEDTFLFLLVDEVESLAMARQASLQGNEPSDAVRAVNALLTQIDRLRCMENVLVLATSNLVDSLDAAFLDRVDWQVRIAPPGTAVIYKMLLAAVDEMMRVHLIHPYAMLAEYDAIGLALQSDDPWSARLKVIAQEASGMSGRTIKKTPFLAYARCSTCSLSEFFDALYVEVRARRPGIDRGVLDQLQC